jgi:hypothetical protein
MKRKLEYLSAEQKGKPEKQGNALCVLTSGGNAV